MTDTFLAGKCAKSLASECVGSQDMPTNVPRYI